MEILFVGILALIWSALWFWFVTDSPEDHPTITDKELKYLKEELAADAIDKRVISLRSLLTTYTVRPTLKK